MSYLALQVIRLRYADRERGRVEAEARARLRAMPLVALAGDSVLHEHDGARSTTTAVSAETCIDEALTIRRGDDALVFTITAGARRETAKALFELPLDVWGRAIWNRKESSHDRKWLVEVIVNAGLFAGPPASQIFFGAPRDERDLRHDYVRKGSR